MKSTQGMTTPLLIALIAGAVVLGGVVLFNMQSAEERMMAEGEDMMLEGQEQMREGEQMMESGESMLEEAERMMDDENTSMLIEGEMPQEEIFSGDRLAGPPQVPLIEYNDEDYEKALASDKLILLYFYANWCPTCKAEVPRMEAAFDGFTNENVVGFRVSFKDNQTSDSETELAREHGVGYQHTKVLIKDGERVLKSPESWDTDRYITEITSNL